MPFMNEGVPEEKGYWMNKTNFLIDLEILLQQERLFSQK